MNPYVEQPGKSVVLVPGENCARELHAEKSIALQLLWTQAEGVFDGPKPYHRRDDTIAVAVHFPSTIENLRRNRRWTADER